MLFVMLQDSFHLAKLKKKFTKSSNPYKDEFLLCLSQMNKDKGGDDDDDDTFEKYTSEWISLVDRGGLFNVRQDVLIFTHSVEFQVRQHLTSLVLQQGSLTKEDIIDEVIDDLDVQYSLVLYCC